MNLTLKLISLDNYMYLMQQEGAGYYSLTMNISFVMHNTQISLLGVFLFELNSEVICDTRVVFSYHMIEKLFPDNQI